MTVERTRRMGRTIQKPTDARRGTTTKEPTGTMVEHVSVKGGVQKNIVTRAGVPRTIKVQP